MKKYEVGQLVIGKVSNVRPYAVFFNFPNNVNGMLHISEISDSFVRDIELFASIGDEIKVKVISIDPKNGFLKLSLKQVPNEEQYSSHINKHRKTIHIDEDSFTPLKEKLPLWIEETLKKARKSND